MNGCVSLGTPEQEKALRGVLASLKGVQGATMPALQKAQEIYGYLPMRVQEAVADALGIPLEEVYGVSTFYSNFRLQAIGKHRVSVCLGTACYVRGAAKLVERLETVLNVKAGQTTKDGLFTLDCTRCIGCCGLAPVMTVGDDVYAKASPEQMEGIIAKYK